MTRSGDASGTATVNYNTFDESLAGHASQKSDYVIRLGSLTFNPGETSKTFRVLITDDNFVEGDEVISLALSNPTGTGVGLGSPNTAQLKIIDNDIVPPTTNPIDNASFFVREHYLYFLNREPDAGGQAFWTNVITSCGTDAACIEVRRINVSAAFFLSNEFRNTGLIAYLTNKAAFGPSASGSPAPVLYGQFMRDIQILQNNYVFGAAGADAQLEANKVEYFAYTVARPDFVAKYPTSMTPSAFVDALYANAGVTPSTTERNAAIAEFGAAADTSDQAARARVVRRVAENAAFATAEMNNAFVTMEYFGYLRRDPDTTGFNFWLTKLNSFGGDFIKAEMVKAFISSSEFRQEFGASFSAFQSFLGDSGSNLEARQPAATLNGSGADARIRDASEKAPTPEKPIVSLDRQTIVAPPASSGVSIGGHVFNPFGMRLRAAEVTITGGDLKRSTTTDGSGHYRFDNLPAGSYTITITSKKYTFISTTVAAGNDLKDVDLTAKP